MFKFLLVGQTGVGKSSFINSTFGLNIAETSDFEPCTKYSKQYGYNTKFGDVCLIDTPGLGESNLDLDLKYLKRIKKSNNLDGFTTIYITPLNETRFRPSEKNTIQLLTQELGHSIWIDPWLLFTFAASVGKEKINITCNTRIKHISDYLHSINQKFSGFKQIYLIDNINNEWTEDGISVDEALTR